MNSQEQNVYHVAPSGISGCISQFVIFLVGLVLVSLLVLALVYVWHLILALL